MTDDRAKVSKFDKKENLFNNEEGKQAQCLKTDTEMIQQKLLVASDQGLFFETFKNGKIVENDRIKMFPASSLFSYYYNRVYDLMAVIDNNRLIVVCSISGRIVYEETYDRLSSVKWSPDGNLLYVWRSCPLIHNPETDTYKTDITSQNAYLLRFESSLFPLTDRHKISLDNKIFFTKIRSFNRPLLTQWDISWSDNESLAMFIHKTDIIFIENAKTCDYSDSEYKKFTIMDLKSAALAPRNSYVSILAYDKDRSLHYVKVYKYPHFSPKSGICVLTLPICNTVQMFWNSSGTGLLLLLTIESSRKDCYYDEQIIYYLGVDGTHSVLNLDQKTTKYTSIHSFAWNPTGLTFALIAGSLPTNITIFDRKINTIFSAPTEIRNALYYNDIGDLLCSTAHGNVSGPVEIWNAKTYLLISKFTVELKTSIKWFKDNRHIVFSVLTPTLMVHNGYQVWHYTGNLLFNIKFESNLWNVLPIYGSLNHNFKHGEPLSPKSPLVNISKVKAKAYKPPDLANGFLANKGINLGNAVTYNKKKKQELSTLTPKNNKKLNRDWNQLKKKIHESNNKKTLTNDPPQTKNND